MNTKTTAIPLYRSVANSLRDGILSQGTQAGRLPTEGELCKSYGVSPITVRKAMEILTAERLIVRTPRRGTFVVPPSERVVRQTAGLNVAFNVAATPGTGAFLSLEMLGASEFLDTHDMHVVIKTGPEDLSTTPGFVPSLLRARAAGFLCHSPGYEISHLLVQNAMEAALPVVLLNDHIEDLPVDYVTCDNVLGGALAADYLVSLGHRRLAFLSATDHTTQRDRWEGLRGRALQAGAEAHSFAARQGELPALIERLQLTPQRITAVFCGHDALASTLIQELLRRGLRVPDDVSVVGYDNSTDLCEHAAVPMTTVAQPAREMGARAAQFLFERISGQAVAEPRRVQLAPRLVIRASAAQAA